MVFHIKFGIWIAYLVIQNILDKLKPAGDAPLIGGLLIGRAGTLGSKIYCVTSAISVKSNKY